MRKSIATRISHKKAQYLGIFTIVILTAAAYVPAMQADFIWDDDVYVTKNPLVIFPGGLKKIWFSLDSPSQYFPLVYSMFRVEYALWGLNPVGYHVVNISLHVINALLVWAVLSYLRVRGSWLAAVLWALHPVNVESVAWITERKNTLSTLFYLLAIIAWVKFIDKETKRAWGYYVLSLGLYALALFAKTTACTLPVALFLIWWLRRNKAIEGHPHGLNHNLVGKHKAAASSFANDGIARRIIQLVPFLALGFTMGLISIWWEQHHQGTAGPEFAFTPVERLLIASRAIWFYIAKLIWPARLAFSYPRWDINASDPNQYIWIVACIVAVVLLWKWRQSLGKESLAAIIFFVSALAPTLGFISIYTFKYSFVADHYQYVACIGPIALFSGAIISRFKARNVLRNAIPAVIISVLAILTWRQAHIYRNEEVLWRDTIAKNPKSSMAYNNLANYLANNQRLDEALVIFGEVLKRRPKDPNSYYNIAGVLMAQGYIEQAKEWYLKSLEIDPSFGRSHANLAVILNMEGKLSEAISHLQKAAAFVPNNPEIRYNLACLLAEQGDLDGAIEQYREAVRLAPWMVEAQCHLGQNLLRIGRVKEAISHFETALRFKPDYLEAQSALEEARDLLVKENNR